MHSLESGHDNHQKPKPMHCVICRHVSNGYHFGIMACRACAAFYRRTVAEKKIYRCRGKLDCSIIEQRNMCRACRFLKCQQHGMRPDDIQLPKNAKRSISQDDITIKNVHIDSEDIFDNNVFMAQKPLSLMLLQNKPIDLTTELFLDPLETITKLKVGCNQYFIDQARFRFPSQNSHANDAFTFTYLNHAEICRLEKECIQLCIQTANQYFLPFNKLDRTTKKNVMENFFSKFQIMESIYQTYRNAAILPPKTWLLFNGYIFDETNVGSIVDAETPVKNEVTQSVETLIRLSKRLLTTFEHLQIDDVERAAVAGVLLWQEVSLLVPTCVEAKDAQTIIFKELHAYVLKKCGLKSTGSRFGAFTCLINDIEPASRIFLERETMEKIFDSRFDDLWNALDF